PTLCALQGVTERQIQTNLRELQAAGYLTVQPTFTGGRQTSNRYRILYDRGGVKLDTGVQPDCIHGGAAQLHPNRPVGTDQSKKRGTRLDDNWQPSQDAFDFALTTLGSHQRATRELDKFRDHWRSAAGERARKLDWNAAFRNWVRKADEHGSGRQGRET